MTSTKERLSGMLDDKFGVPASSVTDDITFEELELDSLVLIEFALAIKKELGVTIADWELKPSLTMVDVAQLVDSKLAGV
jgi:acyl carrier protein